MTGLGSVGGGRVVLFVQLIVVGLAATVIYACSDPSTGTFPAVDPLPESSWTEAWSSTVALSPNGDRLYVANPDSGSITAVDTTTEEVVWEVSVGSHSTTVAVDPHGDRVYAAVRGDNVVVVLDAHTGKHLGKVVTGHDPYGVVISVDGRTLFVSESASDSVAFFAADRLTPLGDLDVGPRPRGLAVSADGQSLYVTHFLTGDLTVVDLERRVVKTVVKTGPENNAAQHVAIDPAGGRAYLPHSRSRVTNPNLVFDTTLQPLVTVVDLAKDRIITRELLGLDAVDQPVGMPSAVAFSPDGGTLYVVNASSNDISVVDLSKGFGIGHVEVGDNPKGIIVTADGRTAYVHNALSDDLSVIDLDALVERTRIPITTSPLPPDVLAGKILFHSSDRVELAKDQWISCASCHFEGGHDARTWILDDGPRNTPPIRGLMVTEPFHWSGDRVDLFDFQETIRNVQFGTGLSDEENAHLAAFLAHGVVHPSPHGATDRSERGREAFEASGCASCHAGPVFTDGLVHDVGTGGGPGENRGPGFDTPTLLGVHDTAPYLHDGRAPTLRDVLTAGDPVGPHFLAGRLSEDEIDAVVDYLRTLPQEEVRPISDPMDG